MGKVIAVVNEKGGVAKTTVVKNASVGIAQMGKKVLAIDIDPSAALTRAMLREPDYKPGTICEVMEYAMDMQGDDLPEDFCITHHPEGVDLIISNDTLHATESRLLDAMMKEIVLRSYIGRIRDKYDYIFIDCPAGLGIFTQNAMFAADTLLIPTEAHYQSVAAMQNVFKTVAKVRRFNQTGTKPGILGAVFTKVKLQTVNDREIMRQMRQVQGANVYFFETVIPYMTKIPESDAAQESIFKYAPKHQAALLLQDFTDEFVKRIDEEV